MHSRIGLCQDTDPAVPKSVSHDPTKKLTLRTQIAVPYRFSIFSHTPLTNDGFQTLKVICSPVSVRTISFIRAASRVHSILYKGLAAGKLSAAMTTLRACRRARSQLDGG